MLPSAARGEWLPDSSHSLQGCNVTELVRRAPSICKQTDNKAMLPGLLASLPCGRHSPPVMQTSQDPQLAAPTCLAVRLASPKHILLPLQYVDMCQGAHAFSALASGCPASCCRQLLLSGGVASYTCSCPCCRQQRNCRTSSSRYKLPGRSPWAPSPPPRAGWRAMPTPSVCWQYWRMVWTRLTLRKPSSPSTPCM